MTARGLQRGDAVHFIWSLQLSPSTPLGGVVPGRRRQGRAIGKLGRVGVAGIGRCRVGRRCRDLEARVGSAALYGWFLPFVAS